MKNLIWRFLNDTILPKKFENHCGIMALTVTIVILLVPCTTANYWYDDARWALTVRRPDFSYFSACLTDTTNWINLNVEKVMNDITVQFFASQIQKK